MEDVVNQTVTNSASVQKAGSARSVAVRCSRPPYRTGSLACDQLVGKMNDAQSLGRRMREIVVFGQEFWMMMTWRHPEGKQEAREG